MTLQLNQTDFTYNVAREMMKVFI